MKLNLKRKKYTFSTYCIKNLEDSKNKYDEILGYEPLYMSGKIPQNNSRSRRAGADRD